MKSAIIHLSGKEIQSILKDFKLSIFHNLKDEFTSHNGKIHIFITKASLASYLVPGIVIFEFESIDQCSIKIYSWGRSRLYKREKKNLYKIIQVIEDISKSKGWLFVNKTD